MVSPPEVVGMTLSKMLAQRVAEAPTRVALAGMSARGLETRITYAQLEWGSRKFASILAAPHIGTGGRVGITLGHDAIIQIGQPIMGAHKLCRLFVPVQATPPA